ncbi:MAG: hypothetical protein FGF48_10420, partial [Candidatus Brockarchaeota archaeon]|nr:hypothetical protein [Candidatus Brockarchaeota archaeon]
MVRRVNNSIVYAGMHELPAAQGNELSCRIMIQRVVDRILLKFPFKPPVSIFPLGWLLFSLAYFLGILLKRFKPRGRIPRLLAMAFSLVSTLLFT